MFWTNLYTKFTTKEEKQNFHISNIHGNHVYRLDQSQFFICPNYYFFWKNFDFSLYKQVCDSLKREKKIIYLSNWYVESFAKLPKCFEFNLIPFFYKNLIKKSVQSEAMLKRCWYYRSNSNEMPSIFIIFVPSSACQESNTGKIKPKKYPVKNCSKSLKLLLFIITGF